jgi:hypothetical protein
MHRIFGSWRRVIQVRRRFRLLSYGSPVAHTFLQRESSKRRRRRLRTDLPKRAAEEWKRPRNQRMVRYSLRRRLSPAPERYRGSRRRMLAVH